MASQRRAELQNLLEDNEINVFGEVERAIQAARADRESGLGEKNDIVKQIAGIRGEVTGILAEIAEYAISSDGKDG